MHLDFKKQLLVMLLCLAGFSCSLTVSSSDDKWIVALGNTKIELIPKEFIAIDSTFIISDSGRIPIYKYRAVIEYATIVPKMPDRSGDMVITKDIMSVGKLTIAQVMEGTISGYAESNTITENSKTLKNTDVDNTDILLSVSEGSKHYGFNVPISKDASGKLVITEKQKNYNLYSVSYPKTESEPSFTYTTKKVSGDDIITFIKQNPSDVELVYSSTEDLYTDQDLFRLLKVGEEK